MKIALIINLKADSIQQGDSTPENIKNELKRTNISFDIFNIGRDKFSIDDLAGNYDAVVAAGGDGIVNFTANLVAGSEMPMGIIPSGTLNHFAKDNNIPLELNQAIAVISGNKIKKLDAASVNDKIFVNNSSAGLYALAVRERDKQQSKHGFGKWTAMFLAFISVFKRFPLMIINIKTKGKEEVIRTPIIFVGNNEYKLDPFSLGTRDSLEQGVLSLYIAKCKTRLGIVKLVISAMFNRLSISDDFDNKLVTELRIDSRKKGMHISYDGEVKFMETPVKYKILPKHLKVILP